MQDLIGWNRTVRRTRRVMSRRALAPVPIAVWCSQPRLTSCGLLLLLLLTPTVGRAQATTRFQTAFDSITSEEMREHVSVLASDSLEGREAGSRGGQAAGNYLVEQLRKIGIQPFGTSGEYFQPFGSNYRNILSLYPGTDPELKNEYIVIGSHYDHVGYGTRRNSRGPIGQIHNGADDNASGCATLLELMQAFKEFGVATRRSLVFAFWDGEEKNLLGSKHFVSVRTIPLSQIKLTINIDMVGKLSNDRFEILGTRTAPGLRRFFSERNSENLKVDFNWDIVADSDHHPFVERGVPFLMPFTNKHDDYHRPTDDVDKVDYDGMQRVARVTVRVLHDFANSKQVPVFRPKCRVESNGTRRTLERPLPRAEPRLGVQTLNLADGGVQIRNVVANSAAAVAGFRAGDRVLSFAGYKITAANFRAAVLVANSPAEVVVNRDGQTQTLSITLPGQPRRLGIAWRGDPAEPGTSMLSRVIPGSPADMAGLKVGYRLYQFDGRPLASDEEFLAAIKGRNEVPLRIERDGKLMDVVIRALLPGS